MRKKDYEKKKICEGELLLKSSPSHKSCLFFYSILAARANDHNRALALGYAQDGFALFTLKINVRFAVTPNVAAELEEICNAVFDFEVTVKLASTLVKTP